MNDLETAKTIDQPADIAGISIRRIVVAVDLSPGSDEMVANGAQLAKRFGASVTLLHVFPSQPVMEFTNPIIRENVVRQHCLSALKLTELMAKVRQTGVRCDYDFLAGDPADQVALVAKKLNADLIITTIHKPGSFARVLGLDPAPRILDQADCPVLVFQAGNN